MAQTVGNVMESPNQFAVKIAEGKKQLLDLSEVISSASDQMVQAQSGKDQFIPGTGGETAASLLIKKQGELTAQQQAQRIAAATDWENMAVVLGQDIAQLASQQRQLTTKIQEDSSVSLFDDPLTAIANAFTLPWDRQALEGLETKLDMTKKAADDVNAHVQNSARTAEAIKTAITADSLASISAASESLAIQEAAKARLEAAKTKGSLVKEMLTMDAHQLDAYMKQKQLDAQEESMEMRRKEYERQMKLFNLQLEKETDKDMVDREQLNFVNAALREEGKNPIDVKSFKVYKGSSAKFLDSMIQKGMELAIKGHGDYSHGETIPERFAWQDTIGWKPDPNKPAQEKVMVWQGQSLNKSAEATKNKSLIPVSAEHDFANTFKSEQQAIGEGSPFRISSWEVVSSTPEARSPIWQKYIAPLITDANKAQAVNEAEVINAVTKGVLNREINSSDAAKFVSSIFKRAVETNNAVNEFKKITGGLEQTHYGTRLSGFSSMDRLFPWVTAISKTKTHVELTDPVELQALIQRKAVMDLGLKLNVTGEYPSNSKSFYPPITAGGLVE